MRLSMHKDILLAFRLIVLLLLNLNVFAQVTVPRYWVEFTDKNNSPYSTNRPEEFLSQRAIDRRDRQQIVITEQDIPVNSFYIDSLVRMGLELVNISKWFNGATFSCDDPEILENLTEISFLAGDPILVRPVSGIKQSNSLKLKNKFAAFPSPDDYGPSYRQTGMLKGDSLHTRGFNGQEMLIAILDAGFANADSISSLQHIWNSDRVLTSKDFVKDGIDIFDAHSHGTVIFSIIGGIYPSFLYGTATEAEFILVRTEEHSIEASENIIEEYNWISGAEFADSMGTDLITSSLGYSLFDDPSQNHSYEDMDGKTTPISIGANIAATKGILVVTSAGNSAGPPWFKITAPADADSILAVGAVDSAVVITDFSSRGPSYDGRIKPDVCAMGYLNISQRPDGLLAYCSGTSCSAPVISGLAACLWQAHPEASNLEVVDAIIKSSDRNMNPDTIYGHGIPDFSIADIILTSLSNQLPQELISFRLFPNPVTDYFYLEIIKNEEAASRTCQISYTDLLGRNTIVEEIQLKDWYTMYQSPSLQSLTTGLYILRISYESLVYSVPFMKVR